jgi:hypothetical protein
MLPVLAIEGCRVSPQLGDREKPIDDGALGPSAGVRMEGRSVRGIAKPLRLAAAPTPIEGAATPQTGIRRGC